MLTKKCLQIRIIYYFHNEVVLGWNLTSSSTIIIKLLLIIQYINCGGSKTWALAVGLSTTFYQQYVRGEEIIRESRN